MESGISNNFSTYFVLFISLCLLSTNIIDLLSIIEDWKNFQHMDYYLFETCLKFPLFTRTIFSGFSILTSLGIICLTLLIVVNIEFFISKISKLFFQFVLFIFGPLLLGFCIIGMINWNELVYQCDLERGFYTNTNLSFSTLFTFIICTTISILITIAYTSYEVICFQIDSVIRREGGSDYVRKLFWFTVSKHRLEEDNIIIQNRLQTNTGGVNQQNNTNNRFQHSDTEIKVIDDNESSNIIKNSSYINENKSENISNSKHFKSEGLTKNAPS